MIRIIGRKILMQQGESGAFRILLLDHKGKEISLTEDDKFIFRARYSMESDQTIRKVSRVVKLVESNSEKLYHIVEFSPTDTLELLTGDYHYDLLLDRDGQKSIVVPTSVFTIEESIASMFPEDNVSILEDTEDIDSEEFIIIYGDDDDSDEDDLILLEEDNELDYYYSIITSTPLIGHFNAIAHKTLINTGDDIDDLIII